MYTSFLLLDAARSALPAGVALRAATRADLPAVEALIRTSGLPVAVVCDRFPEAYAVALRGDELVGVAALEAYGRTGLLRSVAVASSERKRGTGIALVADRLAAAAAKDLESVYLLTTTAAPYFRRFGFADADRSGAPAELRTSPELAAICPASATCMRVDITALLAANRIT
jgi:amino-acid N-acetyltransferase